MGLLGALGKAFIEVTNVVGPIAEEGVKAAWSAGKEALKEANNVRMNSRGLSDAELLNGVQNRSNSWAQRAGMAQAFKDRHGR